jgi:hypothetical protein
MFGWVRSHPVGAVAGGVIAYAVGTYTGLTVYQHYKRKEEFEAVQTGKTSLPTQEQRIKTFDALAATYDDSKLAYTH